VIVTAVAPKQGISYTSPRFHGNAFTFNRAFHVTVMERFRGHWCYAVFTPLMMPARFAPKSATSSRIGKGPPQVAPSGPVLAGQPLVRAESSPRGTPALKTAVANSDGL
jgi:hypothetical protein